MSTCLPYISSTKNWLVHGVRHDVIYASYLFLIMSFIGSQIVGMLAYWSVASCLFTLFLLAPKRIKDSTWFPLLGLWVLGIAVGALSTLDAVDWFNVTLYAAFVWIFFSFAALMAWLAVRWALRRGRSGRNWGAAVFAAVVALEVWPLWFDNKLPRDEEMIAHFRAHRAEFEELVTLYRNYRPLPSDPPAWDDIQEIKARRERIGVRYVTEQLGIWLPNPYSPETGKLILELIHSHQFGRSEDRRYKTLKITPADRRYYWMASFRYGTIWKDYNHFPEAPKVENGQLWTSIDDRGRSDSMGLVLESLNAFPPNWEKGDCVYRPIEPKWFIRMCRAF